MSKLVTVIAHNLKYLCFCDILLQPKLNFLPFFFLQGNEASYPLEMCSHCK